MLVGSVLRGSAFFLMVIMFAGFLGLMNVDVRVKACGQPEVWWYDIGTGSVCWRADLAASFDIFEGFLVDFDGDHNTFAFSSGINSDPEYGDSATLGVCYATNVSAWFGYAFTIGTLRVEGPTAHINEAYAGHFTEWFYFWVPKTTPPTDWVVCLQRSDGVNPIEVRDTFWYKYRDRPWQEFTPPSSLNVTIKARCNTEDEDVNVSIVMDGSPTGYTTPYTFTGLTAIHTFSVPSIDPHGCQFTCWSTGEKNTIITATTCGTYTAYYNIDAHDFAVKNVTLSKTVVGQGYCMNITVTVVNQGNFTEWFGVAAPYFDGIVVLTPQQWETFWSLGDVDRDGYIDLTDYDLIEDALWSYPGNLNYNPYADINQDGEIDTVDKIINAFNRGKDIWTYFELELPPIGMRAQRGVKPCVCTRAPLTLTWNTTGVPYGNYTITANATIVLGETDTNDNTYTDGWVVVTIPGDVDGNGEVDTGDKIKVGNALWSYPGEPRYNPNADVNCDGEIDTGDKIVIALHLWQSWS